MKTFYEFFAGGGMARAGLGSQWRCLFANDIDKMKCATYSANWEKEGKKKHLRIGDICDVALSELPGEADLAWASFPCQDVSLAGAWGGLGDPSQEKLTRSGTFWPFWSKMRGLMDEGRAPRLIVLENVYGLLRSNKGRDFQAIASVLSDAGYRFGAMVVDARHFLPQSRLRVFFLAVRQDLQIPAGLHADGPVLPWHPKAMEEAHRELSGKAKRQWVWWSMPQPTAPPKLLKEIIEQEPTGVAWHTEKETEDLLGLMDKTNLAKVEDAKRSKGRVIGTVYRRMRPDGKGKKVQRAEVRFDGTAGCLRTPSGGSSRQTLLIVENGQVRSRLLSPREAARLMGLRDNYILPARYNDAYHVAGDGVAVPVVAHLRAHLFDPIIEANPRAAAKTAKRKAA